MIKDKNMIEFSGKISGQTLNYTLNQERNRGLISASIVSVLLAIAVVVVAILYDTIFFIGLAFPVIFIVISIFAKPSKSTYNLILPQKVYIEGDTLVSENEKFSFSRSLDQVESVIDFGEGYHIKFYSAYRCPKFICQKSLLTKGTIEEFEKLFEGKIIR